MISTRQPTAQTRAASGLITTLLMFLVVGVILVVNAVANNSLTLPWHFSSGQWALVLLLIPVVKEFLTYTLHGLTTGDWTPPSIEDFLGVGVSNSNNHPEAAAYMPMTSAPPPLPELKVSGTYLDLNAVRRYITPHYPTTGAAPPKPA